MSPRYDFQCDCGKITEEFFHIEECPDLVKCDCGKKAKKILSASGGIQTDSDVAWLPSAVKVLQPDHERPITTRSEFKRYLKENRIEPIG